jgi:hypothetical protein
MPHFIAALGLAICTQFAPDSWGSLSGWADAWRLLNGSLRFVGSPFGGNAVSGTALLLGVVSQYQGLWTDNVNCGPARSAAGIAGSPYENDLLCGREGTELAVWLQSMLGIPEP